MDATTWLQLKKFLGSSKTIYVGHQRWLANKKDPWRRRGELFNGEDELRGPPCRRSGKEIQTFLNDWVEFPMLGKKKKEPTPLLGVWQRKSIFWDLPY
jgi:hypothetical protein